MNPRVALPLLLHLLGIFFSNMHGIVDKSIMASTNLQISHFVQTQYRYLEHKTKKFYSFCLSIFFYLGMIRLYLVVFQSNHLFNHRKPFHLVLFLIIHYHLLRELFHNHMKFNNNPHSNQRILVINRNPRLFLQSLILHFSFLLN